MKPLHSVSSIKDPYMKRILSNTLGKDAFALFRTTPSKIAKAVKGLNSKQWQTPPAEGKWSIVQILAHLCDSEIVFSWRIRMALAQSGCPIQAFDENKWAKEFKYESVNWKQCFELYVVTRKANIALLNSLTPAQWKRFGIHQERGKESIERMVQMYAGHDVNHIKQIEHIARVMK